MNRYAVVIAGGKGTRLWPLSRRSRPKQFLQLAVDGKSLLQSTVDRAEQVIGDLHRVLVVAPAEQAVLIEEQLPALPPDNLILEPLGRNTAAAVGLAVIHLLKRDPEAVMGVFPADHLFRDILPWVEAVRAAMEFAGASDRLMTIGLEPLGPSPSYGYLHLGEVISSRNGLPVYDVQRFVEKPTIETARSYLDSREYLWNTGTFAWKVSVIWAAYQKYLPSHFDCLQQILENPDSPDVLSKVYPTLENISIDYGVMEKSIKLAVVKARFERIDLGNLSNLSDLWYRFLIDSKGNALSDQSLVVDGENNLIFNEIGNGITVTFGLSDVILIRQEDVVLALPKSEAYRIKDLLDEIHWHGMEHYL